MRRLRRTLSARLTATVACVAVLLVPSVSRLSAGAAPATGERATTQGTQGVGRHAPRATGKPLRVMTRNLYLGTDIMRPVEATQGVTDPAQALVLLANATHTAREIVDQTSFPVRSRLLARQIEQKRPDLVGLQEVALWRSGPLQTDPENVLVPNATTVDYDFLQILLDRLRVRGLSYEAVSVQVQSDVEAPSFAGIPGAPGFSDPRDVRLTMRDVILKRVGGGTKLLDEGSGRYDQRLSIGIAGKAVDFIRGYNWVDVRTGGKRVRFINTHLEAFSSDIALAQAKELVAGPGDHDGATIIACDCNSDPLDHSVKPIDTVPHSAPYDFLTGEAGFHDQWLRWRNGRRPGWTAGLGELVKDPTADLLDHRIDLVLARSAKGAPLAVDRAAVTGNRVVHRDPATGLWPSDHAGVAMRLRGIR